MLPRIPSVAVAALLLLGSVSPTPASAEEHTADSLRRIESEDPDRHLPIWLAADEATQDGYLKWEEFSPGGRMWLQALVDLARKASATEKREPAKVGCIVSSRQGNRHEYIPNKTLEELATHFPAIYRGRVVTGAEGFIDGYPGTLYEVAVESASKPAPPTLFVYYPLARISAEGVSLCHQGDRYPDHPEVGHQVLIFSHEARNEQPLILSPQDEELFFERADGSLSLPSHYGELVEDVSIEALEARALQLRRAAASAAASPRSEG